ncbi:MAG TPA: hypothetical protein VFS40_07530 [Gemmatimonadales bacterium]|nr:hypothetical protein [Gemmatimonadales bacterium]
MTRPPRRGLPAGALVVALAGTLAVGLAGCRRADRPARGAEVAVASAGAGAATAAGAPVGVLRTTLTRHGDSIRAVATWDGPVAGVTVRLATAGGAVRDLPVAAAPAGGTATGASATTFLPVPAPGGAAEGTTCLLRSADTLACTPWQFVRPSAAAHPDVGAGRRLVIVVRPDGMQVDPDLGGRCTAWRAAHPTEPVWLAVNEAAVPACTGPNGRPTIAQFCAFALLPDGRKVKTAGSSNSPYCEEEFQRWLGERAS